MDENDSNTLSHVIKLDGSRESVHFDAIQQRVEKAAGGLRDINPALLTQLVITGMKNNMTTTELDYEIARKAAYMIDRNTDYDRLAVNILVSRDRKLNSHSFLSTMAFLYEDGLISREYYMCLRFFDEHVMRLESLMHYDRDYNCTYFGYKTMMSGYILSTKSGTVREVPSHMFMRVATSFYLTPDNMRLIRASDADNILDDPHVKTIVNNITSVYNDFTLKKCMHASPTMFNSGATNNSLMSCFLMTAEDDLHSIAELVKKCMLCSKASGGIGISLSALRSEGQLIKTSGFPSGGVLNFMRIIQEVGRSINQGGRRPGAIAVYLTPHHGDIETFLRCRLPSTPDAHATRSLNTGLWVSDHFMNTLRRADKNTLWYLFSEDTAPGLVDSVGPAFTALYNKYVEEKRYVKTIKIRTLWKMVLRSIVETGEPYILFKDHCNLKSNQQHLGVIRNSNLCAEIVEYSSDTEIACCNLASICLPAFYDEKTKDIDYEELMRVAGQLTENLNQVIDLNKYPHEHARNSNYAHRPIAIGVQGYADLLVKLRIPFEKSHAVNRKVFEAIYLGAMTRSAELAERHGAYSSFKGSPLSHGKFQFDLWRGFDRSQLHFRERWEELQTKILEHGTRNSLVTAIMPTASTAQIQGNNECVEPYAANVYYRKTKSGEYMCVCKQLIEDLKMLNLWNTSVQNRILGDRGSIQNISEIPAHIRELYKTKYEIKQHIILELAAERGPFIDQTQSMNVFFKGTSSDIKKKLNACLLGGHSKGLKTGMYYMKGEEGTHATTSLTQTSTMATSMTLSVKPSLASLNATCDPSDPTCESCSG